MDLRIHHHPGPIKLITQPSQPFLQDFYHFEDIASRNQSRQKLLSTPRCILAHTSSGIEVNIEEPSNLREVHKTKRLHNARNLICFHTSSIGAKRIICGSHPALAVPDLDWPGYCGRVLA